MHLAACSTLVNPALNFVAPCLSPPPRARARIAPVAACDGALGTSTQRGSDRRLEGWPSCWRAQIQEARCDRCRRSASNGRGVRRPPRGTWPAGRSQEQATGCSLQRCPKSPSRGRRKAAQGTPQKVPEGPRTRALEQARPGLLGPEDNRPPGRPRRPRTRRTSRRPPGPRGRNGACATTRSSRHHGKPKRSRAGSAQARAGSAQAPDPLRPEPRPVLQPLPGVLCRLSRYAQGLDDRCAAAHPRRTA